MWLNGKLWVISLGITINVIFFDWIVMLIQLSYSKRKDPTAVTVFSRDDIGCTAVHQAAEFGKFEIVDCSGYLTSYICIKRKWRTKFLFPIWRFLESSFEKREYEKMLWKGMKKMTSKITCSFSTKSYNVLKKNDS